MHPIERLRAVAGASGAPPELLAREAASTLGSFADDPSLLLVSARQLLAHHPDAGPLWWLVARVLDAVDPAAEAWKASGELDDDPTVDELADALPEERTVALAGATESLLDAVAARPDLDVVVIGDPLRRRRRRGPSYLVVEPDELGTYLGPADVCVTEVGALGPWGWVGTAEVASAMAHARAAGAETWGVAGVGRVLPAALADAMVARSTGATQVLALALLDTVVGPQGAVAPADALAASPGPVPPELLRF